MRNPSHSDAPWKATVWKFTAWLTSMTTNNDALRWGIYRVFIDKMLSFNTCFQCSDVRLRGLWTHNPGARITLPPPQGKPPLQPSSAKILRQKTLQVQQQQLCKHAPAVQLLIWHDHSFYKLRYLICLGRNHKIKLQNLLYSNTNQTTINRIKYLHSSLCNWFLMTFSFTWFKTLIIFFGIYHENDCLPHSY